MSIEWSALLSVALAGIVIGAGLPTLFAIGTRMFTPQVSEAGAPLPITTGRKAIGYLCFGICIAAIVAGVFFLAAGGHS